MNITWSPAANSQISTVLNYRPNLVGDPNLAGGDPNNFLDKTAVTLPDAQHDPARKRGDDDRGVHDQLLRQ